MEIWNEEYWQLMRLNYMNMGLPSVSLLVAQYELVRGMVYVSQNIEMTEHEVVLTEESIQTKDEMWSYIIENMTAQAIRAADELGVDILELEVPEEGKIGVAQVRELADGS